MHILAGFVYLTLFSDPKSWEPMAGLFSDTHPTPISPPPLPEGDGCHFDPRLDPVFVPAASKTKSRRSLTQGSGVMS